MTPSRLKFSFHLFRVCSFVFFLVATFPPSSLYAQRLRTATGAFIERTFISNTTYKLSWGNVQFKRTLPDTFTIGFYDNPKFEWENPQYICLRAESDTDSWYSMMLPCSEDGEYIYYTRPLGYDTINNYVAYPGSGDTLVTIEHSPTGRTYHLITWDRCGNQENYSCIRNVLFDTVHHEATVIWSACGSAAHPEVYAVERTAVIPLHP
jgi:hypothetical protein